VFVTGVSATGAVGTATAVGGSKVTLVGVQAAGIVATPLVWGLVDDSQTPNWQPVNDTQSGVWTTINDAQTPNWQAVNDSQTGNWVQVVDGNTVVWVEIPT
jgi:hypothetical protein